ncbi:hypothetical protein [Peribacillus acanthi]|uniref:hypothetical protein n=1 Tax=Peribacillus acanthi TaxID=2171554 RepID=UPI000D3E59A9|nr:hypothetical protein [Peribacillus acanthi]
MQLDYYQLELVQQYIDLLDTVEQGFQYVLESFHNLERTEGDQVLSDIFTALGSIGESHQGLLSESLQSQFDHVIKKALELEGKMNQPELKKTIVEESLFPAFMDWKKEVQAFMMPLVRN